MDHLSAIVISSSGTSYWFVVSRFKGGNECFFYVFGQFLCYSVYHLPVHDEREGGEVLSKVLDPVFAGGILDDIRGSCVAGCVLYGGC
jgi:hypothetical protein